MIRLQALGQPAAERKIAASVPYRAQPIAMLLFLLFYPREMVPTGEYAYMHQVQV